MNNAETIAQLAADIEATRPLPGSPAAVFSAAVQRWLAEGGSLDEHLGLVSEGPGRESAVTLYRRATRDRHLRQAHALCAGATPWGRSVSLAAEVRRFESVLWPRWNSLIEPPAGCSELRRHLFFARKAGDVDLSQNRLHAVCTG